ncbi:hypothetical protein [Dactylosporangium sp. NPDC048998]|uniref:hypothetical protein n=1 Tax=Dactylosporangium sp. NPDC048998 TaxID=3363976 RepID=UPI00371BC9E3
MLPVAPVGFTPPVDLHNAVAAGSRRAVPVTFTSPTGAAVQQLSVEFAFDDGATRRTVPRAADGQAVVIDPAAGARFVSLQAHATDSGGSTARRTVLPAYRIAAS